LNSLPNAPVDLLEFKLRDLIRQRLEEGFGPEFWMAAVPVDIRGVVERKIESHNKSHPYDIEKFSSSATKLSFLDIMDYETGSGTTSTFRVCFPKQRRADETFF
jgi:hypothetical protein